MQDIGMRIEHRHDDIGLTETFPDSLHHGLAEVSASLRKPGSIHENGLHAGLGQNADDFVARRLRLRGDNRYFLPHEGIEESGFAGVRRPHKGNPAASVISIAHDKNSFGSGTRRHRRSVAEKLYRLPFVLPAEYHFRTVPSAEFRQKERSYSPAAFATSSGYNAATPDRYSS